MHIEILVEDSAGAKLLDALLPKLLGEQNAPHTWRLIPYKGIGKIPEQDRPCDTWELLADAIYPGGRVALKKQGYPLTGQLKHEWAQKIGPHLDPDRNLSPSFGKLRDGLRRLITH